MKIFVNGESAESEENVTVEELVRRFNLPAETTLVEHNGVALRRRDWPDEKLRENDRIEILRVAAGG